MYIYEPDISMVGADHMRWHASHRTPCNTYIHTYLNPLVHTRGSILSYLCTYLQPANKPMYFYILCTDYFPALLAYVKPLSYFYSWPMLRSRFIVTSLACTKIARPRFWAYPDRAG